ncbi:MAG: UDP-N-acetylmuramate dehydrogenase [Patescibacteria group bacterium]
MIEENISLKNLSYYKIGGNAKYYLKFKNKDELIAGLKEAKEKGIAKMFITGGVTNLLIDDGGYDGLILHNDIDEITDNFPNVKYGAGLLFSKAINYCIEKEYSGFEWAGGLPGSLGGAVRGNAGSFGGETKDNIGNVESLDLETLETKIRSKEECAFTYRGSIFKNEKLDECILFCGFFFKKGQKYDIEAKVKANIRYRLDNQPLNYPSAGSTFKNVPVSKVTPELAEKYKEFIKNDPFSVVPVALLLSEAGLKGKKIGNAQIAEKHPNFLINLGDAKSSEVLQLIEYAKKTVKDKFGVEIETEIIYLK